jgi:hypothetical protein
MVWLGCDLCRFAQYEVPPLARDYTEIVGYIMFKSEDAMPPREQMGKVVHISIRSRGGSTSQHLGFSQRESTSEEYFSDTSTHQTTCSGHRLRSILSYN